MRRHPPGWLAWPLAALSLSASAAAVALVWRWPGLAEALIAGSAVGFTVDVFQLVGAPVVGAVVAARRPANPYGWLLLSLGLASAALQVATPYATLALVVMDGTLPFGWPAAWVAHFAWGVMVLHVPLLFLLFPTGRLPSDRWRWLVWAMLALAALVYAAGTFVPGRMGSVAVDNPLGVTGTVGAVLEGVLYTGGFGLFGVMVIATGSVFTRRRRAAPLERLQLKWFAYAAALFALVVAGIIVADTVLADAILDRPVFDTLGPVLFGVALNAVFAAVGVAVLRYRLYEIDRIVSRTVTYALLTAVLAGVYVVGVLLLTRLLAPLAPGSDLAVAGATLAAAAAFAPARRRIQQVVDRRFNRGRYDAEQVLAAFREQLRGDHDLAEVSAELLAATARTVQPLTASLWLADGSAATTTAGRGGGAAAADRFTQTPGR